MVRVKVRVGVLVRVWVIEVASARRLFMVRIRGLVRVGVIASARRLLMADMSTPQTFCTGCWTLPMRVGVKLRLAYQFLHNCHDNHQLKCGRNAVNARYSSTGIQTH